MLKAILKGKAGRVTSEEDSEEQSWRDVFRKREDLLTAVFFSRLRYLSQEGEQKVLALLVGEEHARIFGEVQEIIFWPRLKGHNGRKYVEPDVLILFEDSLLMIEVKPPFGGDQKENQWDEQIKSLILQREITIPEKFHFLALGRNTFDAEQSASNLMARYETQGLMKVHNHEWSEICRCIYKLTEDEQGRDQIIYKDWLDAFSLFGLIESPLPFDDLIPLSQPMITDWGVAMRDFEVPVLMPASPLVDWQRLVELAKKMRLEVT